MSSIKSIYEEGNRPWYWFFRVFYEAIKVYVQDGAFFHGAALAYYTLFSFVPIIYLTSSIFGRIVGQETMQKIIVDILRNQVGIKDTSGIIDFLKGVNFDKPSLFFEILSIGVLIYGCSAFLISLKRSINEFFNISKKKRSSQNVILSFFGFHFLSLTMLAFFALLIIVFYFVQAFIFSGIEHWITTKNGFVTFSVLMIQYSISILCNAIIFTFIFKYLHDGKVEWKLAIRGAIVTAFLLFFSQLLIRYYLQHFFALGKFGLIGSLFFMLAWVHYSAQIIFLGAKFTSLLGIEMGKPIN